MRKTTTLVLKNLAVLGICLLITFAYGKWAPLVAANQIEDIEPNLSRQGEKLRFIDWQPNGNVIAAGSLNNIWLFSDELIEIGHLAVLDGYQLASIAWSPDGSRLAILAGNEDNRSWNMQIWNVITSAVDVIVTEYDVPLYYLNVLWSPDGARLAISVDNEVQLRSASSGALLMTLNNFNHEVTGINWSHDGSKLATTSVRQIQIWDMVSGSELNSRSVSEGIQFAVWSPDDSRLAITSGNLRDIQIWDALTLQPVSLLQGNSSAVTDLAWGPSNLASVTSHSINIWDVDSQQIVRTVQASTRVYSVAWNSEGTQIAYGGSPSTPEIVDAPSPSNCTFTIAADDAPALISVIDVANADPNPVMASKSQIAPSRS